MNVAALIIGIDGWERYTKPLIDSIRQHEPSCAISLVDNESKPPYPRLGEWRDENTVCLVTHCKRHSYSKAINLAHDMFSESLTGHASPDWYIVLSNDVLCTGPFIKSLEDLRDCVAGPQIWHEHGLSWIVGWCVAIPRNVWDAVGGWDEGYQMSSWEDVDFSTTAVERGFALQHLQQFPFIHLDQRQRFGLPDYPGSEAANAAYFARKHAKGRSA